MDRVALNFHEKEVVSASRDGNVCVWGMNSHAWSDTLTERHSNNLEREIVSVNDQRGLPVSWEGCKIMPNCGDFTIGIWDMTIEGWPESLLEIDDVKCVKSSQKKRNLLPNMFNRLKRSC